MADREPTNGPFPVCFATSELGVNGPDRVIAQLAITAASHGHPTTLVTGTSLESQRESVRSAGVTVVETGASRYPVRELRHILPLTADSVVIATQRMIVACGISMILQRSRARLVVRPANHPVASLSCDSVVMTGKRRAAARAEMLLARRIDAVACQSPEVAAAITSRGGRLAAVPQWVVPNPISLGLPTTNGAAAGMAPDVATGSPTLVTMGRLSEQKGYDLLLRALPPVVAEYPRLKLWVLGQGEEEPSLRRAVAELGLGENVELLGHREQPHGYVARADLYVMSSRYEGLSNALIEAQLLGVPAVATTGSASGDQVVDEPETGWLCPPGSIAALSAALLAGAAGHGKLDREEISRRARAKFDPDSIWARYVDFVHALA